MKRRFLVFAGLLTAISLLCACGNKKEDTERQREREKVSVATVTEESATEETEESTEVITDEPDDSKNAEEDSNGASLIPNYNNFIEKDGLVYFYAPAGDSLNESALFANFAPYEETDLYVYNPATGQVWEEDNVTFSDEYSVVYRDKAGRYTIGERYEADNDTHIATYIILPDKDGNKLDEISLGECVTYLGIDGDELFYIEYSYETSVSSVYEVNLTNGEKLLLGEMRLGGNTNGKVDQVVIDGDKVYFSYGLYEGTGEMYTGGYYVTVTKGQEKSLTSDNQPSSNGEAYRSPAFCVNYGDFETCKGEPDALGIGNGYLGWFDNYGCFRFALTGYAPFTDINEGETAVQVETGTVIGDKIYFVENVVERDPLEDVGWRYAYRRLSTEIKCADVLTGDVTVLLSIAY